MPLTKSRFMDAAAPGRRRRAFLCGIGPLGIACVFLTIAIITLPVTNVHLFTAEHKGIKLEGGGYPSVKFGTYGYCTSVKGIDNPPEEYCTKAILGYDLTLLYNLPVDESTDGESRNIGVFSLDPTQAIGTRTGMTDMVVAFAICSPHTAFFALLAFIKACYIAIRPTVAKPFTGPAVLGAVGLVHGIAGSVGIYLLFSRLAHVWLPAPAEGGEAGSVQWGPGGILHTIGFALLAAVTVLNMALSFGDRRHRMFQERMALRKASVRADHSKDFEVDLREEEEYHGDNDYMNEKQ